MAELIKPWGDSASNRGPVWRAAMALALLLVLTSAPVTVVAATAFDEASTPRMAAGVQVAQRSPNEIYQKKSGGLRGLGQKRKKSSKKGSKRKKDSRRNSKKRKTKTRRSKERKARSRQSKERKAKARRSKERKSKARKSDVRRSNARKQKARREKAQRRRKEQNLRRARRRNRDSRQRDRREGQRQDRRRGDRNTANSRRTDQNRARSPRRGDRQRARRTDRAGRRTIDRGRARVIRESRRQPVRSRIFRDARGREREIRSRRYRRADRRYRNRFRDGRSIYWLAPIAGLAIGSYIVSTAEADYDDYYRTFRRGPLVPVDRRYALGDIIEDPAIRNTVQPVSLDVITFASGSADVSNFAFRELEDLADAMLESIEQNPNQVFLIEGHTDAVGNANYNLALSEERAAAVVNLLVSVYDIPARNLEAVGYGEEYLLIETGGNERRNRRVVIRAIGPILASR